MVRSLDSQWRDMKQLRWLIISVVVVFVLWQFTNLTLLYPIRLLVTFVHETGHGLTAILTGGRFEEFVVFPNGAGVALTRGGNPFFIIQMGYLGAALFGAVLLYLTNHVTNTKWVAVGLGIFFIGCAILYTGGGLWAAIGAAAAITLWSLASRATNAKTLLQIAAFVVASLTLIFISSKLALIVGVCAGFVLLLLGIMASHEALILVLNVLAMLIGLNAFDDIRFLLDNSNATLLGTPNDALSIATYTHTPAIMWVILWCGLSVVMMIAALMLAARRS
jgi:hypothetical protein